MDDDPSLESEELDEELLSLLDEGLRPRLRRFSLRLRWRVGLLRLPLLFLGRSYESSLSDEEELEEDEDPMGLSDEPFEDSSSSSCSLFEEEILLFFDGGGLGLRDHSRLDALSRRDVEYHEVASS